MFKKIKQKLHAIADMVNTKAVMLMADTSGSDTTEKIGMVVVAVVIVGLLAAAVNRFMPGLFDSIGAMAQSKLQGLFG